MDGRAEADRMAALYAPAVRTPPSRIDAEQSVLGGVMLDPSAWPLVSDVLAERDFYNGAHALIWKAIAALSKAGKPFDAVTVGDFIASRGQSEMIDGGAYVVQLAATVPSAANVRAYAAIVADMSSRRRLIEAGTAMVEDGLAQDGRELSELLTSASQRLTDLQPTQAGGLRKASEGLSAWYAHYCELYESGQRVTGIPTQWAEFNDVTHGLQPATLYLIAARPSMGKSVFGLNLATFAALRNKTVGVFSLEMSLSDCLNRCVSSLTEVPHDFLIAPSKAGDKGENGYTNTMYSGVESIKRSSLYIDDTPSLTVRQFEARARRMHAKTPLDLLVVDHVHDFRIDPKLARFEYGEIVQVGKVLAKEWNIPVVMLAQLNRNVAGRTDKRPTLADLRESGELEQKGDVIAFLHREDYYDNEESRTHLQGVVELHFAKGRNIRAGARLNLRNRFDVMRLDDWSGDFPRAPDTSKKTRGITA